MSLSSYSIDSKVYKRSAPFPALKGGVNGDGAVSLADAIPSLQIISTMPIPSSGTINKGADANGDGKIGLAEAM